MPSLRGLKQMFGVEAEAPESVPGAPRSFTNIPLRAGKINPDAGSRWEYVEDAPAQPAGRQPPGPRPTEDDLAATQELLNADFGNRERFEKELLKELGANPFEIDPMEEVERAQDMLPDLFQQAFGGQVSWGNRKNLTPEQSEHWNNVVNQFNTHVFNRANMHRQMLRDAYDTAMNRFDKKAETQRRILEKLEERQFQRKEKKEQRAYEASKVAEERAYNLQKEEKEAARKLAIKRKENFESTLSSNLNDMADLRQKVSELQVEFADKQAEIAKLMIAPEEQQAQMNQLAQGYQNQINEISREVVRRGEELSRKLVELYNANPTEENKQAAEQIFQKIKAATMFAFQPTLTMPQTPQQEQ